MRRRLLLLLALTMALIWLMPEVRPGWAAEGGMAASSPIYMPAVLNGYAGCVTVPTLLAPADGSTLSTLIPRFRWNDGNDPNATAVRLEVSTAPAFQEVCSSVQGVRRGVWDWRFTMNLDPATTYYWRSYVTCYDTVGPYSDTWSFTTGSGGTLLPAPTLLAPPDGSTLPGTTTTLEWAPVDGASGYIQHLRRAGTISSGYSWVTGTTYPVSGLAPGVTIEWWIEAWNGYAIGAESERWLFTPPAVSAAIGEPDPGREF